MPPKQNKFDTYIAWPSHSSFSFLLANEGFPLCMGLFLTFGFVGISACLWFNQKLYSVFEEADPETAIEMSST